MSVILSIVLPLALSPPAPAQLDAKAAAAGKTIYQRYCASCHGVTAKGDGVLATELKVPPPNLTLLARNNKGEFPLARVIRVIDGRETARAHGTSDMPVWGEVFPKTAGTGAPTVETAVSWIAHYLWSVQQP